MTSDDRPRLSAVGGLARVPGPPARPAGNLTPRTDAGSPQRATEEPPRTANTKPKSTRRASERSSGGMRETTVSLPVTVEAALRGALASSGATLAEVMLNAVEATGLERLKELVATEKNVTPRSGMFPHRVSARNVAREARVTTPLNIAQGNLDVLDRLVEDVGAASRSHLLAVALRAHLESR